MDAVDLNGLGVEELVVELDKLAADDDGQESAACNALAGNIYELLMEIEQLEDLIRWLTVRRRPKRTHVEDCPCGMCTRLKVLERVLAR